MNFIDKANIIKEENHSVHLLTLSIKHSNDNDNEDDRCQFHATKKPVQSNIRMHPIYCNQVPNNFKSSCSCLPNPYGMNQYIDGDNFFPGISNPEYSMNCNCSFTKPNFPGNFPLPFNHLQHLNIRYSLFNLNQWYQFYHSHQYGQQKILTTEEDEEPLDLSLKTLSNINGSSSQQHQHDYDDDHHHHRQQQQSQQADHLLQLNQIPNNKSLNDCWYHQMESLKIPSTYSMEVYNTSLNKSLQNNTLSSYTNVIQKSNELTQCTFNVKINKSKSIKQLNIQQTNKFNLTKPIKQTKSSSQRNCTTYLMHTANRVASIFQNLDHKSKTSIEKSVYSKKKKKSTSMHKLHCSQSTIN
ncbi:Mushroom body large-type Kenyon cell-specific protein [Schistosoma japonicum]|nr:Mushroom body large-type Kenyon cell-specific protein [Schistosoma japonicum]